MAKPDITVSDLAIAAAGTLSLAAAMGIGRFAFTPMLPLMIRAGEIDVTGGAWLAAANYLGYFAGAWSAARLPWSAPKMALAALLGIALLTAAMAPAQPLWAWAAWRLLSGVGSAWVFVATSVWCLGALAERGRSALGGMVYAGVGLGLAITGLYCLAAGSAMPPAALWWQLGALALVLSAGVAAVLYRLPPVAAGARFAEAAVPLPRGTAALVLCYGVMGFGYILPATFLPVLARSLVDDPRLFGLAWPLFGATAAASTLVAAWWLRRMPRLRLWAWSQSLMGIGVLLPSLWLSGWTIAWSALLVGSTFMVITLLGVQEIRARAPAHGAAVVARISAAFATGQIAGPVLSTLLLQWPAVREQALNLALQTGAAALLASAAWLWRHAAHASASKELSHVN